jgi:hypothetical protein
MGNQWHSSAWVEDALAAGTDIPSTPTLVITDHANGLGSVTISGTDSGTTNTIFAQSFSGLGTATWSNVGARSGNGDVAYCLVGAGHYLVYCRSVNGDGNQAVSSVTYATVTSSTQSYKERILDAVQARIQAIGLSGIAGTSIVQKKLLHKRWFDAGNVPLPAVLLTPETPNYSPMAGTLSRDDIAYRILVTCIHADNQEATGWANQDRQMLWYEKIMKAFRNQQLAAVNEVVTMTVQPGAYVDASAYGANYLVSTMVIVVTNRETRGL